MKLISKYGYDNVKISVIFKEVGIFIGGFYHHYKSKGDLIVEIYKAQLYEGTDFFILNLIRNIKNANLFCLHFLYP